MNETNQSPIARRRDFLKAVALATGATEVEAQVVSPDTKTGEAPADSGEVEQHSGGRSNSIPG